MFDYLLIDNIIHEPGFSANKVDDEHLLRLFFNVLPKGETFLHLLAKK